MTTTRAAGGICAACKYGDECVFMADSEGLILQYEQFEPWFPAPEARQAPARARKLPGKERNGYAGLCVNCENRETCTYPKPEGGVWRCEDYV